MKPLLNLPGIITVLNTPFTSDDQVDTLSLRRNVRAALKAGVAGFLVPAMASEVGRLSEYERDTVLTCALEESKGRVPVIGGASAATQADRVRYARRCVSLGCAGVLVSLTYQTDELYERELREVAAVEPSFLMVQDWDFSGYGAPVALIARLFDEVQPFRCLKVEVVPAGRKYSEVLAATDGRLHVSGGWAVTQMIEALDRGVHAFMPTGMHAIYTRIFALYQNGDRAGAAELFQRVLPVLAFSNQHLDISIHFFKRLLHAEGLYDTPNVREPLLPFDGWHERIAQELIAHVLSLTASLTGV